MLTMKELDQRLKVVEEEVKNLQKAPTVRTEDVQEETPDAPGVPTDYRKIVNEVLNAKFALEVEPVGHDAAFQLTIRVPEEYSNAPEAQRKDDRRVKLIKYSEGSAGVREYAELVYKNLDAEVRARIVAER